jgi:hypothetical protein
MLQQYYEYQYYYSEIGNRYTIVEGELEEDTNGIFIVSKTFQNPCIYVNTLETKVNLVVSKDAYIGRYSSSTPIADCLPLCFEWHDSNIGTQLLKKYKPISIPELQNKINSSELNSWLETYGFIPKQAIEPGDLLVYSSLTAIPHIAIYIGNNRVLQHEFQKLSSIDALDLQRVRGIYRYAQNLST